MLGWVQSLALSQGKTGFAESVQPECAASRERKHLERGPPGVAPGQAPALQKLIHSPPICAVLQVSFLIRDPFFLPCSVTGSCFQGVLAELPGSPCRRRTPSRCLVQVTNVKQHTLKETWGPADPPLWPPWLIHVPIYWAWQ